MDRERWLKRSSLDPRHHLLVPQAEGVFLYDVVVQSLGRILPSASPAAVWLPKPTTPTKTYRLFRPLKASVGMRLAQDRGIVLTTTKVFSILGSK